MEDKEALRARAIEVGVKAATSLRAFREARDEVRRLPLNEHFSDDEQYEMYAEVARAVGDEPMSRDTARDFVGA